VTAPNQNIRRHIVFDIETIPHPLCRSHNHEGEHGIPAPVCHRAISMVMLPIEIESNGASIVVQAPIIAGVHSIGASFAKHDSSDALDELAVKCERHIIECMTKEVRANWPILVTWNGRGFDLPMLYSAGFEHGVDIGWLTHESYRDRYRGRQHLDLQDAFTLGGAGRAARMAAAAQRLGWPGKLDVDGKSVEHLWRTGAMAHRALIQYNGLDTLQEAAIMLRVLFVQGAISKHICFDGTRQLIEMASKALFPFDGLKSQHLIPPWEALDRLAE
jgi:predicted PolB exonuclease-like 3'-5' exonuclease